MRPLWSPPFVASPSRTTGCSHIREAVLIHCGVYARPLPHWASGLLPVLGSMRSRPPASLSALLPGADQSAANDKLAWNYWPRTATLETGSPGRLVRQRKRGAACGFHMTSPSTLSPLCSPNCCFCEGGMDENVPLPPRSLQQRTMGFSSTMGIMTTLQLSCTRAMFVLAMTQAATPALLSTGKNFSGCQPSSFGHSKLGLLGLLGQEVVGTPEPWLTKQKGHLVS